MRKPYRRALLGASALVVAVAAEAYLFWPKPAIQGVLKIGFQNAIPYHFPDANGKPTGPVVELLREAARRRHIQLEWVYFPGGPVKALASGALHLWPLMGDLPERREFLYISPP